MGQSRPLFVYFHLFYMIQIKYKLIKALMVCLRWLEGVDESIEPWQQWQHPIVYSYEDPPSHADVV